MNFARKGLLAILLIAGPIQSAVAQKVGNPGGNALLYFVKSGSHGKEGSAPLLSSWMKYSKDGCPSTISSWTPSKSGAFCAANKAATTFGPALASLCDAQYSLQCRLLLGKYTSKGVKSEPSANAIFWYFDGKDKYPVEVSAKSDRKADGSSTGTARGCATGSSERSSARSSVGSSERTSAGESRGSSGATSLFVNGADMCGRGGTAGSTSCVETSDEFNYNTPIEVPDLAGAPASYGTRIAYVVDGTIYRSCAS